MRKTSQLKKAKFSILEGTKQADNIKKFRNIVFIVLRMCLR